MGDEQKQEAPQAGAYELPDSITPQESGLISAIYEQEEARRNKILNKQKTEIAPLQEDVNAEYKKLHGLFQEKKDKKPDLPPVPDPMSFSTEAKFAAGILMAVATVGSAALRLGSTGAMKSLAAAMNGISAGRADLFHKEMTQYNAQLNSALLSHQQEMAKLDAVIEDEKLTISEKMMRINMIGKEYGNLLLANERSWPAVLRLIGNNRNVSGKITEAKIKTKSAENRTATEEKGKTERANANKSLFTSGGSPAAAEKKYGPKMEQAILQAHPKNPTATREELAKAIEENLGIKENE